MPHRSSETRPLTTELIDSQRDLLGELVRRIGAMDHTERSPPPVSGAVDGFARFDRGRSPRTLMLDGARGSGKTSLMLTFVAWWRAAREGKADDLPDEVVAVLRRLYILPMVDLQPVPARLPIYAWLMQAFAGVCRSIDARTGGTADWLSGDDGARESALVDDLQRLQHDAVSGWNSGQHAHQGTLDDWLLDRSSQLESWWALERRWRRFVWRFAERLEATHPELPRPAMVVVPVDDLDLYTGDGRDILLALRRLWHPRVVFLLTGDSTHLEEIVTAAFAHQLGVPLVDALDRLHGDGSALASPRRLGRNLVDKVIPWPVRLRAPSTTLVQVAREGAYDGALARVHGFGPRGRGSLQEQIRAYSLVPALEHGSRLLFRPLAQIVDRIVQAAPGAPGLLREVLARWDLARTPEPFFEPAGLRADPPVFRRIGPRHVAATLVHDAEDWVEVPTAFPGTRTEVGVGMPEWGARAGELGTVPVPLVALLALDAAWSGAAGVETTLALDHGDAFAHSPLAARVQLGPHHTVEARWPAPPVALPEDVQALWAHASRLAKEHLHDPIDVDELARRWVHHAAARLAGAAPTRVAGERTRTRWLDTFERVAALASPANTALGTFLRDGLPLLATPESGLSVWVQAAILAKVPELVGLSGLPPVDVDALETARSHRAHRVELSGLVDDGPWRGAAAWAFAPWALVRARRADDPAWWLDHAVDDVSFQGLLPTYTRQTRAGPVQEPLRALFVGGDGTPHAVTEALEALWDVVGGIEEHGAAFDPDAARRLFDAARQGGDPARMLPRMLRALGSAAGPPDTIELAADPGEDLPRSGAWRVDGELVDGIAALRLALHTNLVDQGEAVCAVTGPALFGGALPFPPLRAWLDHELWLRVVQGVPVDPPDPLVDLATFVAALLGLAAEGPRPSLTDEGGWRWTSAAMARASLTAALPEVVGRAATNPDAGWRTWWWALSTVIVDRTPIGWELTDVRAAAAADRVAAGGLPDLGVLNHLPAAELATAYGIGAAQAEALVAHRPAGGYASVDAARAVKGVGRATADAIRASLA